MFRHVALDLPYHRRHIDRTFMFGGLRRSVGEGGE